MRAPVHVHARITSEKHGLMVTNTVIVTYEDPHKEERMVLDDSDVKYKNDEQLTRNTVVTITFIYFISFIFLYIFVLLFRLISPTSYSYIAMSCCFCTS